MSLDERLGRFASEVNDDRNVARALAVGLLDRWDIRGLERVIAIGRINRSIDGASDASISDTLDFVEKVLSRRHTSKRRTNS